MFHEPLVATLDVPVFLSELEALPSGLEAGTESSRKPGVLGCSFGRLTAGTLPKGSSGQAGQAGQASLRRTVQVRLGTNPAAPRDGCPGLRPSSRSRDSES